MSVKAKSKHSGAPAAMMVEMEIVVVSNQQAGPPMDFSFAHGIVSVFSFRSTGRGK